MRKYSLSLPCSVSELRKALLELDSRRYPLSTEAEGARLLKVEYVEESGDRLNALVRVIYRLQGRKCWSDLYNLAIEPSGELSVLIAVKRISGIGRTDPDFLITELVRRLFAGQRYSSSSEPRSVPAE